MGRRGNLRVRTGYYVYVGSALGPGGVKARVSRHIRGALNRHWHIDYLRAVATPLLAWYNYSTTRLEHDWAQKFAALADVVGVERFGCSDCRCASHLFYMPCMPDAEAMIQALGGKHEIESWPA